METKQQLREEKLRDYLQWEGYRNDLFNTALNELEAQEKKSRLNTDINKDFVEDVKTALEKGFYGGF